MSRLLCVAPELPVAHLEAALEWYRDRLGFEPRLRMEDYAIVSRDGVDLHLFEAKSAAGAVSLHIFALDIDALAGEAEANGAQLDQPVEQKPWGTREFRMRDPFGNLLKFTEAR
jgi:uncharacterized glyoxalase superfamily protein PhnB